MLKEFNPHTHSQYDVKAREKAKRFWISRGYSCTDNPDQYGVDLMIEGKGRKFFCEVEVKQSWHGLTFNYETLHIPLRKAKFLTKPTVFMVFNASLHMAALVSRTAVKNAPRKEVPNREIAQGERFFDVPAEQATFLNLIGI